MKNPSPLAVETRGLRRVYRSRNDRDPVTALDGVDIRIGVGEVHGLLGPNGAGKTTLVKILSTVLLPSAGSAAILGHDVVRETAAVRRLIGTVFGGDRGLYGSLTGRQNLDYWGALYQVPRPQARARADRLLERMGLADRADHLVEAYSRGMKQRLHLARGLMGDARVIFLDEPTIGMDPIAAQSFRGVVAELRAEGRTILLTTHDMAEAEALCDQVSLIDSGRVIAVETPRSLSRVIARFERVDFETVDSAIVEGVRAVAGVAAVHPLPGAGSYRVELSEGSAVHAVLGFLVSAGVSSVRTSRPSLEEVYIHFVGKR